MKPVNQPFSRRSFHRRLGAAVAAGALADRSASKVDTKGEWREWGRDPGGNRFSPLTEINRDNVAELQPAWTHHCGEVSDGSVNPTRTAYECTPLMADGTLYVTTPYNRVLGLDPETGTERWAFDPGVDLNKRYNLWANRGVGLWQHGSERRLLHGTLDGRLIALDAATGKPCPDFGSGGSVDVRSRLTSPPTIYEDLAIIGGNAPTLRAFDVRSGKLVWTRHKVPPDDYFARATWNGDSWRDRRGGVAWAPLSVDVDRGLVYVPCDSPTYDYYGGDRVGHNLYANCLLALHADTGKLAWHFQATHHDIWDYDLCAQPVLCDVKQRSVRLPGQLQAPPDGQGVFVDTRTARDLAQTIPAVAQISKQGFVYVLNRETGKPLFGIEERRTPQSCAPGEYPALSQPIPYKPAPFVRQSMTPDELSTVTPEHHAWAKELADRYQIAPLYHPGTEDGVIIFPCNQGGGEWGGGCYDPRGRFFVNGTNLADIVVMESRDAKSPGRAVGREIVTREGLHRAVTYRRKRIDVRQNKFWDPEKLWPCQQPPWGVLSAIDLWTGEYDWQAPLGEVPELTARGLPPTGTINLGGPMSTAGDLVFIGASNDRRFRAFDSETGAILWEAELEGSGHANPMTYAGPKTGRQFVVIAAGGGNKLSHKFTDALQAFALPA